MLYIERIQISEAEKMQNTISMAQAEKIESLHGFSRVASMGYLSADYECAVFGEYIRNERSGSPTEWEKNEMSELCSEREHTIANAFLRRA